MKLNLLFLEADLRLRELERAHQADPGDERNANSYRRALIRNFGEKAAEYMSIRNESIRKYNAKLNEWKRMSDNDVTKKWDEFIISLSVRARFVLTQTSKISYPWTRNSKEPDELSGVKGFRAYIDRGPNLIEFEFARNSGAITKNALVRSAIEHDVPIKPLPELEDLRKWIESGGSTSPAIAQAMRKIDDPLKWFFDNVWQGIAHSYSL